MVMTQTDAYCKSCPRNKLPYNGKELQHDVIAGQKLDWYDYGARFYDPQIGRFHGIDPHSENYYHASTYASVENNPISYFDPDGLWERRGDGWFTDNPDEIQRFIDMLNIEQIIAGGSTIEQANNFIEDDAKGELGKSSDGVPLLSGFTLTKQQNDNSWAVNIGEAAVAWMEVQKSLDPSYENQVILSALKYAQSPIGLAGLFSKGRKLLEWEFLRQAKYNRSIKPDFSRPVRHHIRGLRAFGRGLGVAGIAFSGADIVFNGPNVGNVLDLIMARVAFIPKVGWIISGSYF